MSASDDASGRLPVGPLLFDAVSGELAGPAGVERLAPKPAAFLELMASRPGGLVSRDEIRERLWPGGKVEFDQGIAFAVREVRAAIEAAGGDPALIETIPKRGFRLNAALPLAQRAEPSPAATPALGRRSAAVAALGVIAVVVTLSLGRPGPPAPLPAVVVFAHDVEQPVSAALASAIGFELTTELTRALAGRVAVVGPTGTSTLSGPNDTEGARGSLGACLVVSGGIGAMAADSVVVFTQIVRTSDRVHVWASLDTVMVSRAAGVVVPEVLAGVEGAIAGC